MSTTIKRVREIMRQADRVAPDAYEDAWNDPVGQQTLARIREGAVVESGTTTDWTDPHPLRLPSRRHRNSRLGNSA